MNIIIYIILFIILLILLTFMYCSLVLASKCDEEDEKRLINNIIE